MTPGEERSFRGRLSQGTRQPEGRRKADRLRPQGPGAQGEAAPALDDEFAKSLGVPEGLEELHAKVRKEILEGRERAARNETASEVLDRDRGQDRAGACRTPSSKRRPSPS